MNARSDGHDKTVLMITYVFPPAAWVGGHRTMKYCKFLGTHGWKPIVLTARPTGVTFTDNKLLKQVPPEVEVHRTLDFDPAKIEAWLARNKTKKASAPAAEAAGAASAAPTRSSWWKGLKRAIKSLAKESPDSHLFWVPFAVMRGLYILATRKVDVIYCSSPPHSSHFIAYLLAKISGKPYVLDFRDPWCVADSISPPQGKLPWLLRWETKAKRRIVRSAALVVCVSEGERNELLAESDGVDPERFVFITNGFDSADVNQPDDLPPANNDRLTLIHAGTIYPGIADELFTALKKIVARNGQLNLKVDLLGEVAFDYQGAVEELERSGAVVAHGFVPHAKALQMMQESDVLLILMGGDVYQPSHLPSKGFEYLRIGRPVLAITKEGELSEILHRSGLGTIVRPYQVERLIEELDALCELHRSRQLSRRVDREFISKFERSSLARDLARRLDEVHERRLGAAR
jgi:glycosyltransferase involved in cell wall biosynthesis